MIVSALYVKVTILNKLKQRQKSLMKLNYTNEMYLQCSSATIDHFLMNYALDKNNNI